MVAGTGTTEKSSLIRIWKLCRSGRIRIGKIASHMGGYNMKLAREAGFESGGGIIHALW